jgi:hypothetical protein
MHNLLFSIMHIKKKIFSLELPEEVIIPNLKATTAFTICSSTKINSPETQNH